MTDSPHVARRDDPRMHTAEFAAFSSEPSPSRAPSPAPLTMKQGLPWVALGGSIGALCRWGISQALPVTTTFTLVDLPWSTLLANVLGCLAMGVLAGYIDTRPPRWRFIHPLVGVGFCGGFTTMSTFVFEIASILGARYPIEAFQYSVASIGVAIAAVCAGWFVGHGIANFNRRQGGKSDPAPSARTFDDDFTDVPGETVGTVEGEGRR